MHVKKNSFCQVIIKVHAKENFFFSLTVTLAMAMLLQAVVHFQMHFQRIR